MQKLLLTVYHFLLFTVPLFFMFRTDELFEFNKMILVYALTAIILALWLARMISERKLIVKRTIFDLPIFLFLMSQILSTILSIHPRTSWLGYYSRFHGGLASWFSYTILYYALVSNIPRRAYKGLFFTTSLAALVVSVYAILEHFGHSTSCLLLTKGKSFGVDCWIQKVQDRVFATFGQPNWLAAYVITLLPVTLVVSLKEKGLKNWQKWFFSFVAIAEFLTLLFTKSRSGFLGFLGGIVVLVLGAGLVYWRSREKKKLVNFLSGFSSSGQKKRAAVLGLAMIAAVLAFGTPYSEPISEIVSKITAGQPGQPGQPATPTENPEVEAVVNRLETGGTDSGEIRKIVWEGAINVWRRYPVFGSGVETFAYSYYQDRPAEHNLVSEWDFLYNKAHNELLNFLATTGVVGLSSYLLIFVWVGIYVLKSLISDKIEPENKFILLALFAGLIAQSISNFFGFSTVMVTVLLFLYLGVISETFKAASASPSSKSAISAQNKNKNKKNSLHGLQYLGISVVAILSFFLLAKIYLYWSADVAYSNGKSSNRTGPTDTGLIYIAEAIQKSPGEAIFYNELSGDYASAAVQLAETGEATAAAETAQTAIMLSDTALKLNSKHMNFYKTRAQVFITLAQLDPDMMKEAERTLTAAIEKSPTDAKLWYNLGIVQHGLNKPDQAIEILEKTVALKPNYGSARYQLAQIYERTGNPRAALENYQYIIDFLNPNDERVREAIVRISTSSAELD